MNIHSYHSIVSLKGVARSAIILSVSLSRMRSRANVSYAIVLSASFYVKSKSRSPPVLSTLQSLSPDDPSVPHARIGYFRMMKVKDASDLFRLI
jgi:hypothetical protein